MSNVIKGSLIFVGSIAGLYGLMGAISPNPEELKKKLPENHPQYMKSSQDQARAMNEALRKAANDPNPHWRR